MSGWLIDWLIQYVVEIPFFSFSLSFLISNAFSFVCWSWTLLLLPLFHSRKLHLYLEICVCTLSVLTKYLRSWKQERNKAIVLYISVSKHALNMPQAVWATESDNSHLSVLSQASAFGAIWNTPYKVQGVGLEPGWRKRPFPGLTGYVSRPKIATQWITLF